MALRSAVRMAIKLNYNSKNFRLLNVRETKILNGYVGGSKENFLHTCSPMLKKQEVRVVIDKGGEEIHITGKEGDSILDAVVDNKVDIPGYGVCEGTLSCSTCHVKLNSEDFNRLTIGASDEELDMLDMAPDVCATSRLGCQVYLNPDIDGLKVKVPSEVKDMRDVPRVAG